jgi:hypothetical protein
VSRPRTKRAPKSCGAIGCSRPHYAKGFCRGHYREALRASKRPGNVEVGKYTHPPKSTPSDQGRWLSFSPESQIREVEIDGQKQRVRVSPQGQPYVYIENEVFRAVDDKGKVTQEFQVPGVVCADCHHHWTDKCGYGCGPVCIRRHPVGWCDSPLHPIFFGKWEPTWPTRKESKPKVVEREYLDHLRFCDGKCEMWSASTTCARCGGPTRKTRMKEDANGDPQRV